MENSVHVAHTINATCDVKVRSNTIEYAMAFMYSDGLYFL